MKYRTLTIILMAAAFTAFYLPSASADYDLGDQKSETLVIKAWDALAAKDFEAVKVYTAKCLELYEDTARDMQAKLSSYPAGKKKIESLWALNDVATALYIQGEALRSSYQEPEATRVFQKLIDEFSFGQCWDPKGWYWKPVDAAKEKLLMIEKGISVDFGDYTSATLVSKAWDALKRYKLEEVLAYTGKCIDLYKAEALKMQSSLNDFPKGDDQYIHSFWALNDVATALFIQGEAYQTIARDEERAREVFEELINDFYYGQCWDPKGWFWKPAEGAKDKLMAIVSGKKIDFGDYTSSALVGKAWTALRTNDTQVVLAYTDKAIKLYSEKAAQMQDSLDAFPSGTNEEIFQYWALNDVAVAYFIKGIALKRAGKSDEARESFLTLQNEYTYGQCWDSKGWWWKPAEKANEWIASLNGGQ